MALVAINNEEIMTMLAMRSILSVAGAAALMVMPALQSTASAADVDVDIYRTGPVYVAPAPRVYVAPAPRVYVAPARVVTVGPNCVTRRTRVWVGDHYAYRTVRRCY